MIAEVEERRHDITPEIIVLIGRLSPRLVVPDGRGQLILQLKADSLGGLLAHPAHLREGVHILLGQSLGEAASRVGGEHGQSHTRPHALGSEEPPEQLALVGLHKAVEGERVFADHL